MVNAAATARFRPLLEAINRAVPPPAGVQPERARAGRAYFGGGETGQGVSEGEGVGSASSGQTGEDEGANDAAAAAVAGVSPTTGLTASGDPGAEGLTPGMSVADAAVTREELDAKVRRLTHDVYQAYQTIEGNSLSQARKDQIHSLRPLSRAVWRELHGGSPPRPTRKVFVGYFGARDGAGFLDVAAFEAAGGRAKPAGPKWKLETEDRELAAQWGLTYSEMRA